MVRAQTTAAAVVMRRSCLLPCLTLLLGVCACQSNQHQSRSSQQEAPQLSREALDTLRSLSGTTFHDDGSVFGNNGWWYFYYFYYTFAGGVEDTIAEHRRIGIREGA